MINNLLNKTINSFYKFAIYDKKETIGSEFESPRLEMDPEEISSSHLNTKNRWTEEDLSNVPPGMTKVLITYENGPGYKVEKVEPGDIKYDNFEDFCYAYFTDDEMKIVNTYHDAKRLLDNLCQEHQQSNI